MKKPIDIYRRYKKHRKFQSTKFVSLMAMVSVLGAAEINKIATQPIPKYYNGTGSKDPIKKRDMDVFRSILNTANAVVELTRKSQLERFKKTGAYGRGKFNINTYRKQYNDVVQSISNFKIE